MAVGADLPRSASRKPTAEFIDLGALDSSQSRFEVRLELGGSAIASGPLLMFFPERQIRVHLYGYPCDMRKYGPRPDMRS